MTIQVLNKTHFFYIDDKILERKCQSEYSKKLT